MSRGRGTPAGLSREFIARTALELADEQGLRALTIRGVAHRLGVEPMSIYKHLANKEAMLDGVWDEILDSVILAADHPDPTWQGYLRHIARSAIGRHCSPTRLCCPSCSTAPHAPLSRLILCRKSSSPGSKRGACRSCWPSA